MSQGKIHFGSEVWTWTAGKGTVAIRDENRKKFAVPMTEITGCSWTEIERSRWKQTRWCEVTPAKVRNYIERELRRET
jgi:predicted RNA-binding Zn ribbon-like protein